MAKPANPVITALSAEIKRIVSNEVTLRGYAVSENFTPYQQATCEREADAYRQGRLALQRVLKIAKNENKG